MTKKWNPLVAFQGIFFFVEFEKKNGNIAFAHSKLSFAHSCQKSKNGTSFAHSCQNYLWKKVFCTQIKSLLFLCAKYCL